MEKSAGIGFFGLLTIAFVVLKLTGFINWSWWLVLLPLYGPIIFGLLILAIFLLFVVIKGAIKQRRWNKDHKDLQQ